MLFFCKFTKKQAESMQTFEKITELLFVACCRIALSVDNLNTFVDNGLLL
jgi:hypothetical protein